MIGLISIPGYYSAVFLIDKVGRKRLQQIGFLMLGIIYFTMGISWFKLLHFSSHYMDFHFTLQILGRIQLLSCLRVNYIPRKFEVLVMEFQLHLEILEELWELL
jgi:lysine/ornithine N-monooxygenase